MRAHDLDHEGSASLRPRPARPGDPDTGVAASAAAAGRWDVVGAGGLGSDIVFQRDRYDPSSEAGRITLAHELTHVIQQRTGPVDGTAAPGGIRLSDPSDRFEQEAAANAERAMNTPAPAPATVPGPDAPAVAAPVQRQEEEQEEEEPTAQGTFVQREEEMEETEE
jgi:hypothetical protein